MLLRKERDYCTWFVILVARRGAPAKFTPQKLINQLPFVSRHYACEKICPHNAVKQKKMSSHRHLFASCFCGKRGIRTPGTSQFNGFQDRRNRPLCHLSAAKVETIFRSAKFLRVFKAKNVANESLTAAKFRADNRGGDGYVERFRTVSIDRIGRDQQFVRNRCSDLGTNAATFVAHNDYSALFQ